MIYWGNQWPTHATAPSPSPSRTPLSTGEWIIWMIRPTHAKGGFTGGGLSKRYTVGLSLSKLLVVLPAIASNCFSLVGGIFPLISFVFVAPCLHENLGTGKWIFNVMFCVRIRRISLHTSNAFIVLYSCHQHSRSSVRVQATHTQFCMYTNITQM